MDFMKAVENIQLKNDKTRVASAYIVDFRNLTEEEVLPAFKKSMPQYTNKENIQAALSDLDRESEHDACLLYRVFLKILLDQDGFMAEKKDIESEIIAYEQSIIDKANEELYRRTSEKRKNYELLNFVLETAWDQNGVISHDERNLINKLKNKLRIPDNDYRIMEAKLNKFPRPGNDIHNRGEIDEMRKKLQAKGLVFPIRDSSGLDFDVIPSNIAASLREVMGIELKAYGYSEMLNYKVLKNKKYLIEALQKHGMIVDGSPNMDELKQLCISELKPSFLLGGSTPRDGIDNESLKKWCADLSIQVSGTKNEIIARIIDFYDNLLSRNDALEDSREIFYEHYDKLASRDHTFFRSQQLIDKDREIEVKFEDATDYLFERKLRHKPLTMTGTNHPDGIISNGESVVMWDNKSKETPVNLQDHIKQFDGYIKNSERKVSCFMVIGPDFTTESRVLAMQYNVQNGVMITLITATELKQLAEDWASQSQSTGDESFPLGYLFQPGRFDRALVPIG